MSGTDKQQAGIKQNTGSRLVFLFVLVLAFTVRIGVWAAYNRTGEFVQPDTMSYLEPGLKLLESGSFPSFGRTPVYPLFLAGLHKTLSPDPAILALVHIAVSLITLGIMSSLCFSVLGYRTAVLTSLFMALDVTSAISASHLLSEMLFTLLLSLCLLGLVRFYREVRTGRSGLITLLMTGIGFSVLPLCRPIAILLFIAAAFWLFLSLRKHTPRIVGLILCFCACSTLLPLAWVLRNHTHTGRYFFCTISSWNIYAYRAAWNVSRLTNRPFSAVYDEFGLMAESKKKKENLNEGELAIWEKNEGIRILKANPLLTVSQGLEGLIRIYFGISDAHIKALAVPIERVELKDAASRLSERLRGAVDQKNYPLWIAGVKIWAILYLLLLYSGVIAGLIEITGHRFSTEQRHLLWLLLLVIAYSTFLPAGAESYSRFRVPAAPALSILGAAGWIAVLDRLRRPDNRFFQLAPE